MSSTKAISALVLAAAVSVASSAEAAAIKMKAGASGKGTIVNDGTGDASNTDGGVSGSTSTLSELGFSVGTLFDDLTALTIYGSIPDGALDPITLNSLLVFLTLDESTSTTPTECDQCGPLYSTFDGNGDLLEKGVNFADSLSYEDGSGPVGEPDVYNPEMVLAQVDLANSDQMLLGQVYPFQLSPAQVLIFQQAILAALGGNLTHLVGDAPITGLDLGDIRLGISLSAAGAGFDPIADFSTAQETVPEPASLALLGAGLAGVAGALRRRRRS
jgi:hypothetical protein